VGRKYIAELFDSLFGCKHSHYSFSYLGFGPLRVAVRPSKLTGTYVHV